MQSVSILEERGGIISIRLSSVVLILYFRLGCEINQHDIFRIGDVINPWSAVFKNEIVVLAAEWYM